MAGFRPGHRSLVIAPGGERVNVHPLGFGSRKSEVCVSGRQNCSKKRKIFDAHATSRGLWSDIRPMTRRSYGVAAAS